MSIGKWSFAAALALLLSMPLLPAPLVAQDLKAVAKPEELGFAPERLERLTKIFLGYVEQGQLPGAVLLIAKDDKIAYYRAFGYRDREKKISMTHDSIFRLASMTKPIVSAAAMTLVEEGRLDLAAPVSKYIPEFKDLQVQVEHRDPATGKTEMVLEPQKRPMTMQDLLRHTAGLVYAPPIGQGPVSLLYRDAEVSNREETLAQMIAKMSMLPLAHQPGEVWEYSMATDVLGRVLEVVTGQELDRIVEERIVKPLGMTSTGFYTREADKDRIAQPQNDPATGQRPAYFDPAKKPKRLSGGGGMVGTASDYLRFAQMMMGGGKYGNTRVLAPSTVTLMTTTALRAGIGYSTAALTRSGDIAPTPAMGQGFGLGFAIRTEPGQNPLPGSVGSYYWTGAYGTTFYIDPEEKMVVIMMIQAPLSEGAQYRRAMRYLTYQALTAAE